MITNRLVHLAAFLCVCLPAAAAQESFELYRPLYADSARFERESRVRDLFAAASAESREGVLQLYEADRAAGHVAWLPALTTLSAAEKVLGKSDGTIGPDLEGDFLAALDVRLTPGFFAVREEGKGEAITVHVTQLYATPLPRELVIGLDWVAPDGSRYRARTEAFTPREFGDGLEMYIRPPVSEASIWRLSPTLRLGERELRAPGVLVPCIDDVEAARKQLQAGGEGSRTGPRRDLWRDWTQLQDYGVRATSAAELPERLGQFGLPGGTDWTQDFGWVSFGSKDAVGAWAFAPQETTQDAVLILTDGRRHESAVFAGELESRWNRFSKDHRSFVLALSYTGEAEDRARLDAIIAELRAQGVERFGIVASGDTAVMLPAHLRELPEGTVGRLLIHSSPTVANGVRLALAAPVLGVAYGQESDAVQRQQADEIAGDAERWWVRRRGPAFLTELEIPALLGRWMDGSL
jgi:hypothetical protein